MRDVIVCSLMALENSACSQGTCHPSESTVTPLSTHELYTHCIPTMNLQDFQAHIFTCLLTKSWLRLSSAVARASSYLKYATLLLIFFITFSNLSLSSVLPKRSAYQEVFRLQVFEMVTRAEPLWGALRHSKLLCSVSLLVL